VYILINMCNYICYSLKIEQKKNIKKHQQQLNEMIKQLNIKGREKSLNQTLLAYIDLCVSLNF